MFYNVCVARARPGLVIIFLGTTTDRINRDVLFQICSKKEPLEIGRHSFYLLMVFQLDCTMFISPLITLFSQILFWWVALYCNMKVQKDERTLIFNVMFYTPNFFWIRGEWCSFCLLTGPKQNTNLVPLMTFAVYRPT